jgi:hypothetical protein
VVNVVAFATVDHTKNSVTPITVTAFGNVLQGTYVLQSTGVDVDTVTGNFGVSQFAAAIVLDGSGGVTSGEQTYTNTSQSVTDSITGGSYFVGADGRGTLTLNTADQNLGQQGTETFSLVVLSSSQALIAKVDDRNVAVTSNESSTGTMDLQTSVSAPAGGYAFVVTGTDIGTASPTAVGGVLNVDSPGAISGTGSVSDQDLAGSVTYSAAISGTVSNPDAFGAVQFNLLPGFASTPMLFTGYIVDGTHMKLIETDVDSVNFLGAATGGVAIGQGAATGTLKHAKAFAGTFVFGIFGQDFSGLPASLASVGIVTADGLGHLNPGFNDEFLDGLSTEISSSFHGPYKVDSTGTGRVDALMTYKGNIPGPEFIFYLTGNGNPPLVLDFDNNIGSLGAGIAYPAATSPSFGGEYGVSFVQNNFGSEDDVTGQVTADPVAQTLAGIVDTNFQFSPAPDTPLTGTFASSATPNRLTGTLSNQFFPSNLAVAYYLIDSGHGFFVETDSFQLSFGYFTARSPVCAGCP